MEEKERYKWSQDIIVECPYEDYDYIVDTKNNIIFDDDNFFKLIDYLNQQDKRIKELEEEICKYEITLMDKNSQLKKQLAITEKALDYAIFELDFAKNHSQSTNSETIIRIDKLRNKILDKAKEMLGNV